MKINNRKYKSKRKARGFTLLEVLISMLILAIGVLGIAALQYKGMKYSTDSAFRSQINVLAYNIADRMRMNKANATAYTGDYTLLPTAPAGTCSHTTAANAANDLVCWRQQVHNALPPNSEANITASGDFYTVLLQWTDREANGTDSEHAIEYTFQP